MYWTEVSCILYARARLAIQGSEYGFLEKNNIKSLESLLGLSEKKLQAFSDTSLKAKALVKEIRAIRKEFNEGKAIWLTTTEIPIRRNDDISNYKHWLPLSPSRLLDMEYDSDKIENSWEDILKSKYKEFDTLVHVTHIDKAATIFQENKLRSNPVRDNSVFSKVPGHPNKATEVIWFGPTMRRDVRQNESRYGNVAFFMNRLTGWEGIRRYPGDWNYYFVEVIDYATQSACRILVTHNKYEHLTPYDPTVKGGPWYYDQANDKHYWLTDIVRWDGTYGKNGNSLEIMREGSPSVIVDSCFQHNLLICPVVHGPTCLSGFCDVTGTFDDAFYVLVACQNPIYSPTDIDHLQRIEDTINGINVNVEDEVPCASAQLDSPTHKVFQGLLDIDIKNVKSKIIFWENIKTTIERITGQPMSKAELKTICELDGAVKKNLLQLILEVASEIAIDMGRSRNYALLEEFPYSLCDAVKSSEYISKNLEQISNQVQ